MTGYCHVFAPEVTDRAIHVGHCPDCNRRSRFIGFFQDWFGWRSTCLRCGRSWDGGEWLQLDFVRGSRRKSIESAKRRWRSLARIAARQGEDVQQASREAQEPDQAPENTTKSPKGKQ